MKVKKNGDFYKWKEGKRLFKAPWVIEYYKKVTDENQYDYSHMATERAILIIGVFLYILGMSMGILLW